MNNTFTVYCHTNKTNGKKYIGITSKDPKIRWNKGLGYKKGQYFGKIIEIYGWDNFEHEILFQNLSKEEAQEKEIELIKLYKTNNPKFGYNRSKGGEFDNESLMIKVNQYDLDGNFIKTWNSQIEVAEFLGIHPSNISHSIGRNTQTNGFIFKKYEGNTNNIEPYNKKLVYTKVNQYDMNGNFMKTWNSVAEICKELKCSRNAIIYCCNGKQDSLYQKYIFRYYNENTSNIKIEEKIHPNSKQVGQYDQNGNLINIYKSAAKAIKELQNSGIYNCLQGKSLTCGGYIWKYI